MSRGKLIWGLLGVGLLLVSAWYGTSVSVTTEIPTTTVVKAELLLSLTVSGDLEAVNSVVVTAPNAGGSKKLTYLIPDGAAVKKDDVVVTFDSTDFEKELRLAENDLEVISTKLKQHRAKAEREIGQLDSEVKMADLSLRRANLTITESDTVARIERERALISAEEALITQEKLLADRVLRESDLQSELRLLELERQKVKERMRQTRAALESCTVRAPKSGLVMLAKVWKGEAWGTVEEGDTVWPGRTVLELPELDKLQAVVQIHELDAALVSVGQPAEFSLDAIPNVSFTGEIAQIANLAAATERRSKVKYFKTVLSVNESDPRMKPGMTAKVDIEIDRLDEVLQVPREAVFQRDDGQNQVFVEGHGGFRSVAVSLGKENATHVAILSGLSEGDIIALVDPDKEGGNDDASESASDAKKGA